MKNLGHFFVDLFEDRRLKPAAIETRAKAHARLAMSLLNSEFTIPHPELKRNELGFGTKSHVSDKESN